MSFSRACFALLFCAILAPLSARESPSLVGDWLLDDAPNNVHYAFLSNGVFKAFNIVDAKETLAIMSKWRIEDDVLILFDMSWPVYNREPDEYRISFQSDGQLTVADERAKTVTHWKRMESPHK